jgi:hypothetical protein
MRRRNDICPSLRRVGRRSGEVNSHPTWNYCEGACLLAVPSRLFTRELPLSHTGVLATCESSSLSIVWRNYTVSLLSYHLSHLGFQVSNLMFSDHTSYSGAAPSMATFAAR